jgi:4-amino-4-deoxy-L-arabinose transferase-like glycosyltransferase
VSPDSAPSEAKGSLVVGDVQADPHGSTGIATLTPLSPYVLVIAGATLVILVGLSGRYGYHRDELYYLEAGRHLAWGYPDQPPFTPLFARLMQYFAPGSLVVLRLPSALAAAGVIVLTGLLARELGARRSAQMLAALSIAVSGLLLGAGHLLSTTSFNLFFWTLLLWLIVRVLRTQIRYLWILIGVVAGVGILNSDLVVFLLGAVLVGVFICGPRLVFTSRSLWIGGLIAALLWTPYLVWQARHGWPELAVSRSIGAGGSGSSTPRYLVLPEQLVLVSPYLCPVWIAGLIRLFRDPALRWCRSIAVAYLVLAVVFVATGGKGYYLASYLPVLLAAGSQPAIDWLGRGRVTLRRRLLVFAFVFTALGTVFFILPVLPVSVVHHTPIVAVNYDEGETIGWPAYVSEIAYVYHRVPMSGRSTTSILASNYGEAGAVDRFGPSLGLPPAFGGQDGFWYWGPPPSSSRTFIVVGMTRRKLALSLGRCELATRLNNEVGVDNQEQGSPVWTCSVVKADWAVLWPHWKVLG